MKHFTAKPIGIRLRPSEREMVTKAAALAECSLSELGRRALMARARRILSEAEKGAKSPGAYR